MKKRNLLFILIMLLPIGSIFAQMTYNHWSIQAKGGINTIRGFQNSAFDRAFNPEFGGALEYTITPVIGLGIEYLYQNNDQDTKRFTSNISQLTAFSSINISNLTLQFRRGYWKNFNTYLTVGGGFGFGSYENNNPITMATDAKGTIANLAASFGLNFEYNIADALAIGFEPQFRWNSNGNYNPKVDSNTKDFYTLNLNLRYKIFGSNMHIRNQGYVDYHLDQISNYEHKERQEGSTKSKMQELLIEQAKKEAYIKDSLRADSTAKALSKQNIKDGIYFKKTGQTVEKQAIVDLEGDAQTTTTETAIVSEKPLTERPTATSPIFEPIVETVAAPIEEQFIEKTLSQEVEKEQPVSMKTEMHNNKSLKRYSIVIGSFSNKEYAQNLADKKINKGIESFIIQNEQGMYRVVAYTSNSIDGAVSQVKKMRATYPDAWILVLK